MEGFSKMATQGLRIRFRDLTYHQRMVICNGCGSKGGIIPVPEFLFHASCNHHDFQYFIGGNRLQRKKADLQFYREMIRDAGHSRYYKFWAKVYYRAVRWFSAPYFHWGTQRDLNDLERIIIEREKLWLKE